MKLDNVLVNDDDEASICDFGLAQVVEQMRPDLVTSNQGQGQGGKGFVAPELYDDAERKTIETDVFAFGSLVLQVRLRLALCTLPERTATLLVGVERHASVSLRNSVAYHCPCL